jgi:WD40 repeat protein
MTETVNSVSISNNNKFFVASSNKGEIKIFDLPSGEIIKTLKSFDGIISTVQISPSDKLIACSGYQDCKVIVFDIENDFSEKYKIKFDNNVRNVRFRKDS